MTGDIIIRKQKFRVRVPDELTALKTRKEINDSLQYAFIRMLEKVFEKDIPAGWYIHLDKISIDLGKISSPDFEKNLLPLLEVNLEKTLAEKIKEHLPAHPSSINHAGHTGNRDADGQPPENGMFTENEQHFRALQVFLEKGIFPWWYQKPVANAPAKILSAFGKQEMERLALWLLTLRSRQTVTADHITRRLVNHLSKNETYLFFRSLLALRNDPLLTANAEVILKHSGSLAAATDISGSQFHLLLIQSALEPSVNPREFIRTFFKKMIGSKKNPEDEFRQEIAKIIPLLRPEITEVLDEYLPLHRSTGYDKKDPDDAPSSLAADNPPFQPPGVKIREGSPLPQEGIYISNAGLILTHPFLENLFQESGLLDETKNFFTEQHAWRAVKILWYLQTGDSDFREWESSLCKILCGLAVDTPDPGNIKLTAAERKECREVLKVMLEYWDALRTKDIRVLRANFFNREGKIMWREDHWLLQVERTGIDILTDRIPWGIGTIKLPWLKHLIHVEW